MILDSKVCNLKFKVVEEVVGLLPRKEELIDH